MAASAALAWCCCCPGNLSQAQNPAPGLSPDLQEVVKLAQVKMGDDVIKNYIVSSGKVYHLSADDIIYLNSQGVSSGVISTLQATAGNANPAPAVAPSSAPIPPPTPTPAPAPVPPAPVAQPAQPAQPAAPPVSPVAVAMPTPPPGPEVNFQYFHDQLAPWGVWLELPGIGMVWKPSNAVIAASPGWRPYYDNGQWVQTENGLFWQSDYTWGDIPFHYGRWILNPVYGWVWAPDYVWGPAWVFWRHAEADAAVGWAPLPVGAVFVDGGFMYNGVRVGVDFEFGLHEDCFVFVEGGHFHERFFRLRGREWHYHIEHERLHGFYGRSVIRNEFHRDEHGRFVNNGIGHDRMEHLNPHVERAHFEERHPVGDRERAAHPVAENHGGASHAETAAPGHSAGGSPGGAGTGGGAHQEGTTATAPRGGPSQSLGSSPAEGAGAQAHGASGGAPAAPNPQVNKVFRPPVTSAPASRPAAPTTQHSGASTPTRK